MKRESVKANKIITLVLSLLLICSATISVPAYAEVEQKGLPQIYPTTASADKIQPAPIKCFTMLGSENNLEGTSCYLIGVIDRHDSVSDDKGEFPYFVMQTEYGYAAVMDLYTYAMNVYPADQTAVIEEKDSDYSFPDVGEFVKVLCVYSGYATELEMPLFYYGQPRFLVENTENTEKQQTAETGPTAGETNALRKAKDYLKIMAFSYNGIIKQLEYEGFTTGQATYAADNCGADWNAQAAKKAKDYLSIMAFSRDGLISQLIYEGFTQEQAVYGAEQNGY